MRQSGTFFRVVFPIFMFINEDIELKTLHFAHLPWIKRPNCTEYNFRASWGMIALIHDVVLK